MKTLIIVDFQNDFCRNTGSLYVPGSEKAEEAIVNYINENYFEISDVIFTLDWHTSNHCSFTRNGGTWPMHCLKYSEGAGISNSILEACILNSLNIKYFFKGNDDTTEEYGAFDYIDSNLFDEIMVDNISRDNIMIFDSNDVVICGLAGDYCVKSSIENLLKCNKLNIYVLKDGVASIDNGTTFNNFIESNYLTAI